MSVKTTAVVITKWPGPTREEDNSGVLVHTRDNRRGFQSRELFALLARYHGGVV